MEKNIIWNEFRVNGLPDDSQIEYRDMMFINDSLGYMLGNYDHLLDDNIIETTLYVTSDGGHNWQKKDSYQGEGVCLKINEETFIMLQTKYPKDYRDAKLSNIYISQDYGESWNRKLELPFQLYNIEIITKDFWVGSYRDKVYYTRNAGITWESYQLLLRKTDNRLVVITPSGGIIYMSHNKIIYEDMEVGKSKVLLEFSDDEQKYCDGYAYDKNRGVFLIISDGNFVNCRLYSLSGYVIPIPSNNQIGIMNMNVDKSNVLINGYKLYASGLSKSVFFYSNNNGTDWLHKDFEMGYLPTPVTFYDNEIIAYCSKTHTIIRTSLNN